MLNADTALHVPRLINIKFTVKHNKQIASSKYLLLRVSENGSPTRLKTLINPAQFACELCPILHGEVREPQVCIPDCCPT